MTPNWQTLFAPRPLGLRAMELALPGWAGPVWFASASAADFMELPTDSWLTAAERTRADAFKFGQPRENFKLGRLAGKLALVAGAEAARAPGASCPLTPALSPGAGEGEEIVCKLRSFEIGNGERGEPVVRAGDLQSPTSFATGATDGGCKPPARGVSLSHVNGLGVAVAFAASERVGLDLELIDARRAETVRKGVPLSPAEEVWLRANTLPEATALLVLWTAREALGKALGSGLACKWETLALERIAEVSDKFLSGRFLQHPEFRSATWVGPDAVMSVAFAIDD